MRGICYVFFAFVIVAGTLGGCSVDVQKAGDVAAARMTGDSTGVVVAELRGAIGLAVGWLSFAVGLGGILLVAILPRADTAGSGEAAGRIAGSGEGARVGRLTTPPPLR